MYKVKIVAPYKLEKANPTDTGYDLRSVENKTFNFGDYFFLDTGVAIELEYDEASKDHVLPDIQVRGRSGLAFKNKFLAHFGTIDLTYQRKIYVGLAYLGKEPYTIKEKDRIAQLVVCHSTPLDFVQVDSLEESREGFGSSGV